MRRCQPADRRDEVVTSILVFQWPNQVHVPYPECSRQLIESDNRWVATPIFEATKVLLAEPRNLSKFLLRQTPLLPDPPHVLPNQSAHVHAQRSADYI